MIAYEAHLRDKISDPMANLDEAMRLIEEEGSGVLLSLVQETIYLPFEVKEWRSSAAWTYESGQWSRLAIHGWEDAKWPIKREEVGK